MRNDLSPELEEKILASFVPGMDYRRSFGGHGKALPDDTRALRENNSTCFPQYHDPLFKAYNANLIRFSRNSSNENSGIIICAGPRDEQDMQLFIGEIIANERLNTTHVAAQGNVTSLNSPHRSNCCHLEYLCSTGEAARLYDQYALSSSLMVGCDGVEAQNGGYARSNVGDNWDIVEMSASYVLTITNAEDGSTKTLKGFALPVRDNAPFLLNAGAISMLTDLWKATESGEHVVLHCSVGVGRAGQTALTLLYLQNFKYIFYNTSIEQQAQRINEILHGLRRDRGSAVATEQQLIQAVSNAKLVYEHHYNITFSVNGFFQPPHRNKGELEIKLKEKSCKCSCLVM